MDVFDDDWQDVQAESSHDATPDEVAYTSDQDNNDTYPLPPPPMVIRPKIPSDTNSHAPIRNTVEHPVSSSESINFTRKEPLQDFQPRKGSRSQNVSSTSVQSESVDDMLLRLSNEFNPVAEPGWDTVIYIGPPPQEHQQDDHEYEYIKQHFSRPYLMNSQTLRSADSAQFNKFLGPMSVRAERRLKKLGIQQLIPQDRKPKYYIDLRPMQDDDEAVLMITELTCTPGILSWHVSHLSSGVPKTLIGGKDDLNITSKPHARPWIEVNDDSDLDDLDTKERIETDHTPTAEVDNILELEPEYSALRHYMAIERLLQALAGFDPKLNSAPKVWTFFSIAKFFDCAVHAKITSWIYNWLFAGANTNFIQANPEVAYRMALAMRSPDMMRTTFAMLVGERALMQAGRSFSNASTLTSGTTSLSVHGRFMSHLDDDEINRIDHAAHSLTRRMTAIFDRLANGPLNWTAGRSQLTKFHLFLEHYKEKAVIEKPYEMLREYVRGEIYQALSQNVEEGDLMRLYRTKGHREFGWLKRSRSFADAYNAMPLPQRLLTQSFWSQLENYGLYQELEKTVAWSRGHSLDGLTDLAPDYAGELICVPKNDLDNAVETMNHRILTDRKWTYLAQTAWQQIRDPDVGPTTEAFLYGAYGTLHDEDREIVRAMQALRATNSTYLPGYTPTPYANGDYDTAYPYHSVASLERTTGGLLEIKTAVLLAELSMAMRTKIMREVLTPGYVDEEIGIESDICISHMDILLCLNDDEWKYLPLWAGGLDDGSGGVFAELDVPDMEGGFRGGKMGLGNIPGGEGSVGGSFSMAGDSEDFDEVMTDDGISTVGKASRIATDGTTSAGASTVMSLDD